MQSPSLFLDSALHIDGTDKYAGLLTPLGDNADSWPQEILDEAYRQLPFLSNFEVHANMDRVDEERGFALGSLDVAARSQQTSADVNAPKVKTLQIPFVVREKQLAPIDIFINNGAYQHLTEGRVRAALFRSDIFDAARDRPPEAHLYTDLQPPVESANGYGGGGVKLGFAKIAALTPLLPQLHGRVKEEHVDRLKMAMMQQPSLRAAYMNAHEGTRAAFDSALSLIPSSLEKSAAQSWDQIKPNVVQVRKLNDGNYLLKTANAEFYSPTEEVVPPEMGEELTQSPDLTAQMESDGTVTASPDAAVKQTLDAEEIRVVDQPGIWKVQDKMGNTLTGWCFPQLLSFDLQPLPLTLFSNGSEYALQEHVAGALLGKGTDLPKGRMQGYGALYYLDHGTPRVFLPITVRNSYRGADGLLHYTVVTDHAEELDLLFTQGLKTVVRLSEDQFALPEEFAKWWLPLKGKTEMVEEPMLFTKYASARPHSGKGELVSDGMLYSFRGEPFAKVASRHVTFLSKPDAEFVAVAAGVHPGFVKEALAKAAKGQLVKFDNLRTLQDPSEKMANMRTKIAALVRSCGLRNYDLIKEAALLDDALTADKILGLGFLNAENVSTFVDMLPGLEVALSKIAEMLMASRLGLKDIPEVALERIMAALEDVIQGLKTLQQREVSFAQA